MRHKLEQWCGSCTRPPPPWWHTIRSTDSGKRIEVATIGVDVSERAGSIATAVTGNLSEARPPTWNHFVRSAPPCPLARITTLTARRFGGLFSFQLTAKGVAPGRQWKPRHQPNAFGEGVPRPARKVSRISNRCSEFPVPGYRKTDDAAGIRQATTATECA